MASHAGLDNCVEIVYEVSHVWAEECDLRHRPAHDAPPDGCPGRHPVATRRTHVAAAGAESGRQLPMRTLHNRSWPPKPLHQRSSSSASRLASALAKSAVSALWRQQRPTGSAGACCIKAATQKRTHCPAAQQAWRPRTGGPLRTGPTGSPCACALCARVAQPLGVASLWRLPRAHSTEWFVGDRRPVGWRGAAWQQPPGGPQTQAAAGRSSWCYVSSRQCQTSNCKPLPRTPDSWPNPAIPAKPGRSSQPCRTPS